VNGTARRMLQEVLTHPRYEIIPMPGLVDHVVQHVPKDVTITVTSSPSKGLDATLEFAEELARKGFTVVPHLPARLIVDDAHLKDILQKLNKVEIHNVLVIAGDVPKPAGQFEGALSLLSAMADLDHGIDDIGITGYPESHPFIDDDVTIQSMWDKRRFGTYIVSNICFDPKVIIGWVARVRRRGVELPIYVGMPGVTDRAKLWRISRSIGLGESARFLRLYGNRLARLLLPGGYDPGRLIRRLADAFGDPALKLAGIHIYTFNEVRRTEKWRRDMLGRGTGTADPSPDDRPERSRG
jgi:methylenetetrahydrofolate reductase (NADH)